MPTVSPSTGLTITNPLVKYRALLATQRIKPDPAQYRLALQLQKLYYRLKDYNPELEYRHRLDQISRSVDFPSSSPLQNHNDAKQRPLLPHRGLFSSVWRNRSPDSTLALTPTTPIHESALSIKSPQGLLLYGEVGRGKSMLLDLFADSLPSQKKRRWHFNTFMLETFRRLEQLRMRQSSHLQHEHSVLSLAKDTVSTSPILFLDEFQLPDRAASKLMNSFLMAFFHLGGVLVASSNRMPDELARAAGVEYAPQPKGQGSVFRSLKRQTLADKAAATDFGAFLDVLKARCEIWEMEGSRDWRRDDVEVDGDGRYIDEAIALLESDQAGLEAGVKAKSTVSTPDKDKTSTKHPLHYHLTPPNPLNPEIEAPSEAEWSNKITSILSSSSSSSSSSPPQSPTPAWYPSHLTVYGRRVPVPASTPTGYTLWTFPTLCATNLGPADYISLASTYHTLILDSVPILTLLQKNEARRFITLLDALYESRCRLLIRAAAPPDGLFFPETRQDTGGGEAGLGDEVYQETLAEIYQDSTAPFRPNVSSYKEGGGGTGGGDVSALPTYSLLNPKLRSVLADEDADFGPVYGNGRGHGASAGLEEMERRLQEEDKLGRGGPDFTKTAVLTGEDERFAYKRARSRIWEMCGQRWWRERPGNRVEEWWRPVRREVRFWESEGEITGQNRMGMEARMAEDTGFGLDVDGSHHGRKRRVDEYVAKSDGNGDGDDDGLFRHGASPFRTRTDPPPRFGWQHAWGMVSWGKKAGEWGKGIEGRRRKGGDTRGEEK